MISNLCERISKLSISFLKVKVSDKVYLLKGLASYFIYDPKALELCALGPEIVVLKKDRKIFSLTDLLWKLGPNLSRRSRTLPMEMDLKWLRNFLAVSCNMSVCV